MTTFSGFTLQTRWSKVDQHCVVRCVNIDEHFSFGHSCLRVRDPVCVFHNWIVKESFKNCIQKNQSIKKSINYLSLFRYRSVGDGHGWTQGGGMGRALIAFTKPSSLSVKRSLNSCSNSSINCVSLFSDISFDLTVTLISNDFRKSRFCWFAFLSKFWKLCQEMN